MRFARIDDDRADVYTRWNAFTGANNMKKILLGGLFLSAFLITAAGQSAVTAAPASPPEDYKVDAAWLCRPGHEGPCMQDQTATRIAADGTLTVEPFKAAVDPAVDCFYVYPTVSYQQTPNSNMELGPEERVVANLQVARFASRCRIFAPLYRQATLYSLSAASRGLDVHPDYRLAYEDVRAAWRDYLARDNHGRGVVLIGHSQGSNLLLQLMEDELDGKPAQARLVSALLMGVNLPVPSGADVGGALKSIALCRRAGQTGCVVAYASFRVTSPPPENTRYGKAPAGMMAACVNPAALAGGSATLHSNFPTDYKDPTSTSAPMAEWVRGGAKIVTPFVATPGLLTGECVSDAHGSYLAVTVHSQPTDLRTQVIGGDVKIGDTVLKEWGLHLIDVSLTQGDLIALLAQQIAAFGAQAGHGMAAQ